jgi:hypothetical protein
VRDRVETIDYLCGTGTYGARDTDDLAQIVLLDRDLPSSPHARCLKKLRVTMQTELILVMILIAAESSRIEREVHFQSKHLYLHASRPGGVRRSFGNSVSTGEVD